MRSRLSRRMRREQRISQTGCDFNLAEEIPTGSIFMCRHPFDRDVLRLCGFAIGHPAASPAAAPSSLGMAQDVRRGPHARHHAVTPTDHPTAPAGQRRSPAQFVRNCVPQHRLSTALIRASARSHPSVRAAPITLPPASTSACLTAVEEIVGPSPRQFSGAQVSQHLPTFHNFRAPQ